MIRDRFKMILSTTLFSLITLLLTESVLFISSYFFRYFLTAMFTSFLLFLIPTIYLYWLANRNEKNKSGQLFLLNEALWMWYSEKEKRMPKLLSKTKRISSVFAYFVSSIIFGPLVTVIFIRGFIKDRPRGLLLTIASNLLFVASWVVIYRSGIIFSRHFLTS